MRRFSQLSGLVLAVGLLLAQLLPVDRSNPPVENDAPALPQVRTALRAACYDCHSNETVWPWYSRIAPASWLLAYDVREGRAELNFSTWQQYDSRQRQKKLKETIETMRSGEMPPWYYALMHPPAQLADRDRAAIAAWVRSELAGRPMRPGTESETR